MANNELSQLSQAETGNTNTVSARLRSRKWCFTVNNYSETEYNELVTHCHKNIWDYIVGKEIGENGTPHLQGYIENNNAISFSTLKSICPRGHFEKARGTPYENFAYCSKDNDYKTNMKITIMTPLQQVELWKEWHFELKKELLETTPNDRTIYWYWSNKGAVGKSTFVKYMYDNYNCGFINKGDYKDMINQVFNFVVVPNIILIDIPRNKQKISYSALEDIKNGLIANSKYETGVKRFNPPHIVVFCNFTPPENIFSDDRLIIKCLDE